MVEVLGSAPRSPKFPCRVLTWNRHYFTPNKSAVFRIRTYSPFMGTDLQSAVPLQLHRYG